MKRFFLPLLIIMVAVLALPSQFVAHTEKITQTSQANRTAAKFRRGARSIPERYVVTFHDNIERVRIASTAKALADLHGGQIIHTYEDAIKGFAVHMSEQAAIALSNNPQVASVAEDGYSEAMGVQSTPQGPTTFRGLDRIDQRNLPLDNTYRYNRLGTGVHVYVFDTGIWVTHEEFEGRAHTVGSPGGGFDAFGGDGIDRFNHGTLVSGVIGGKIHGVAKDVQLHSVKVCHDTGAYVRKCFDSDKIAGINWLMANHIKPAVANFSLSGNTSESATYQQVDSAVRNAIAAGITCVIGAGNSNANVAGFYPAHVAEAITVGATTRTDARAYYSNFGSGVDVFAPGGEDPDHYIPGPGSGYAYGGANNVTDAIPGTSMAAPHVTGVVAQYLQVNPTASPASVAAAIINNATTGVVVNPGFGTPNRLLYSRFLAPRDNRADFDGDHKTDISIFRRDTTGEWLSRNSSDGQDVSFLPPFGQSSGDIATPGDYNGDGRTDHAVFRPSTGVWFIATDTSGAFTSVLFGNPADTPVARDYDGDGRTDLAVYRSSSSAWYVRNSRNGAVSAVPFGDSGDIPVPGYYDADDKADLAVFRPSTTVWHIRRTDGSVDARVFGDTTDWPVQADYDGDDRTDIAIFRPSTGAWAVLNSSTNMVQVFSWGVNGDRPVPGDYDGDGKADVAVQRFDASGTWHILNSATGGTSFANFFPGYPVPGGYLAPLY